MHRWMPWVAGLAVAALPGCDKIIGRQPLMPADGPLEGNTEVSVYIPECGNHKEVRKVLFGNIAQVLITTKENEVRIRTVNAGEAGDVPVTLVLTNNRNCETGVKYRYTRMEQQTINYLVDRGRPIGEKRVGGWYPGKKDEHRAP